MARFDLTVPLGAMVPFRAILKLDRFSFNYLLDSIPYKKFYQENLAYQVIVYETKKSLIFCFLFIQTGSGKTFTITGGAERYVDRGIIPRTLSYIFEYFQQVLLKSVFFLSTKRIK